jgi:hypothetical protein
MKFKKTFYIKLFLLIALILFVFISSKENMKNKDAMAEGESDGIAVRVITNPEHYSPSRWYSVKGFSGSPKIIEVNGYEAIQEGRTVYVSASNVAGSNLYTNIYLISYNQNADKMTEEIFNKIVKQWKFNSNLDIAGLCSITIAEQCLHDSDCPEEEYCDSQKAKVTRDTIRLSRLKEIQIKLEEYKNLNGSYPSLGAGTYLPNKTVSVWPSWQETFAEELEISTPEDPINKFGECCPTGASYCDPAYSYSEETCWDESQKAFAGNILSSSPVTLPLESFVYTYGSDNTGSEYYLCASLETNYDNLISAGTPAPYIYCLHN